MATVLRACPTTLNTLSLAISSSFDQPIFLAILVTGFLIPGTYRIIVGEAIAALRRWTMQNCAIVRVTGYGNGGGGLGLRIFGDERSAFDVFDDRADERYQSKQLMTKATVAEDGRPPLSFGKLSSMAVLFPAEKAPGEMLLGPLTAVIPSDRCAVEIREDN